MAQRIDGWTLMGRIVGNPDRFEACDTTVALAALLLLRSQLVQGVSSESALLDLAEVVGQGPMIEVIENMAGYEALRVVANLGGGEGEERTALAARRRLIAIVKREALQATATSPAAVRLSEPISGAAPSRALRRHRAMGARRIRPAG
ncbi:MAG: hypothetical protein JNJ73_03730 [Hyphomonadaceae bacterium]|nr:hypothetical protein [Hyphomonadaceae bacterium]